MDLLSQSRCSPIEALTRITQIKNIWPAPSHSPDEFRRQVLNDLGQCPINLVDLFWGPFGLRFLLRLPYRAIPTPSRPGAVDTGFLKFTQRRSSYSPPDPSCRLTFCGLRLLPTFPIAIVLGCSVRDELLVTPLALLSGSLRWLLVLEVVRISAFVGAQVVAAVERLEPLTADSASSEVVLCHGISLKLCHGPKERVVLFHPKYYITTDKP